ALQRFIASGLSLVAPTIHFQDLRLGQIGGAFEIEFDYAPAKIGAADVETDHRVVPFEHPCRNEMRRPDKSRLVRIVVNRGKIEIDVSSLQNHMGASHDEFANAGAAKPAADRDPLGILPSSESQKTPDDESEFLRKVLDRTLHNPCGLRLALEQNLLEL